MGQPKRPMVFTKTPSGCFVCTSHKTNADGYLRVQTAKGLRMFHRVVLEMRGVSIPTGHEVDHLCKTRGCSNPEHLQVLQRTDHLVKTNKERYAPSQQAAHAHWCANPGITGTALAGLFGVSFSAACRWVRQWRTETH